MLSPLLADALVQFSHTLVTDYIAEEALDQLMATVPEEMGVDGAGIMLADDDDELRFVSASDETVRLIERFQLEAHEGPCVLAATTGQMVLADDLQEGDARFPAFAELAVAAGLRSVHSFPMLIEGHRLGALNLYRHQSGALSDMAMASGRVFADMATAYLFSARRIDHTSRMVERMRQALDRSAPIEQAKGYLAHAMGCPPQEAFEPIRRYARTNRLRTVEVCQRILDGQLSPEDVLAG